MSASTGNPSKPEIYAHHQLSSPSWSYFSLVPLPPTHLASLDPTTIRLALLTSLSSFLGDHGAAIPIDLLAIVPDGPQAAVYLRVPYQDGSAFAAALASTAGSTAAVALRVRLSAEWLTGLAAAAPPGLFHFAPSST